MGKEPRTSQTRSLAIGTGADGWLWSPGDGMRAENALAEACKGEVN